ncbi:hypothetical protein EYC84_005367 [Monilinia fructicola]|uniref:Uncharacterized protein n=1 Tax=Monilinia fructicola TaxID=38448 RepID=A0A5M9JX68_MONFR|nr:hypothetical protein EYC84_005367 [Monilinia fructicola]
MSFFEDTWGLPEFFDPQEELEFLDLPDEDFFDIPADNNQELDALLTTNSEDQSINNESLSEDLEVNRANVLGTRETLRVDPDAMVYETHTEIEKLETESAGPNTGSHSNIQVETQVQDSPVRAVNSQSLQQTPSILEQPQTVISPSALRIAQDRSLSGAPISSHSSNSNTMLPPATPKIGQREKSTIDKIIEEHDRKTAERLEARKAHALRLGYKGIKKNAGGRNVNRSSGGQDEYIANPQNRSMSRHPGVPEPIAARQTYHSHLQGSTPSSGIFGKQQFSPNGPNATISCSSGPFPANGSKQNDSSSTKQQKYKRGITSAPTQQGDNPSVDRVFAPNINRQASGYGNHAPVSHIQSFNSRQLMQPRLPNHSSQRMGQARHGSGPSALNHSAGYEEPHVPLFPERNSWEPPITNIIRGGANNRRQISVSQMQQFEAQQQANAGISPQAFTHQSCGA